MALSTPTAPRSKFRKEVEDYFDRWASDAFQKCITSACAQEFYEYVLTAMAAGKDFSPEIPELSDDSVCETNRGTRLKEGFGSSFNLRSEDEIEI